MGDNNLDLIPKGLQVFRGKEGWVKNGYMALGITVLLLAGYYLAPFAILALENILILAGLVVATAIALYVIFSPTFQNAVVYFLDNMILRLENAVIESDPFSTAQNAIKKLKKRLEEMKGYMTTLRGSKEKLAKEINQFETERQDDLRKAKYSLENGKKDLAVRFSNTAQMRENSISKLKPILERTATLYSFIEQLYGRVDAKIGEAEEGLGIELRVYNITEQSDLAIKSAMKAMSGEDMEMFKRSMDAITTQTFKMVGEIEFFMDKTRPLLEMDKISNAVASEKALDSLREWMNQDTAIMDKEEKAQLALTAGDPNLFLTAKSSAGNRPAEKVVARKSSNGNSDDFLTKYGLDED